MENHARHQLRPPRRCQVTAASAYSAGINAAAESNWKEDASEKQPHPCKPRKDGPTATPKTILPTIPFSALTNAPVISTGMNGSFRFSLRGQAERSFCVPCASPGRMDLGNMSTPPHPSKPPLFFPEPTLCPTLCADRNAPFHPRRRRCIFHLPGTALLSCRSSPFL